MPPEVETPMAPAETGTPTPETTPASGAPVTEPNGGGSQTESPEEIDWKQRYEDLRPEADRRASLLADIEGRNGPERQAQALSEHARIELEAEEEAEPELEDEFDLPPDPHEEIEAIRQELAERDESAAEAEFDQLESRYIDETVAQIEEGEHIKLSKEERDLVVNYGLNHREQHGPEEGKPDLEGGFAALKVSQEAARKRYTDSKESFAVPVGTEGEPKIDLRNKEARQGHALKVFEAAERAKET